MGSIHGCVGSTSVCVASSTFTEFGVKVCARGVAYV